MRFRHGLANCQTKNIIKQTCTFTTRCVRNKVH
jgi:hypothetical protein